MPMEVMVIVRDITAIVTKNMIGTETTTMIEIAGIADRIIITEDTTDVHTGIISGQTSILLVLEIDTTGFVIVIEDTGAGKVSPNVVVEKGHSCLSKDEGAFFYLKPSIRKVILFIKNPSDRNLKGAGGRLSTRVDVYIIIQIENESVGKVDFT